MRSRFEEQLSLLHQELIDMGALCESAIAQCAQAVGEGDLHKASQIPELAAQIGQKERDVEGLCLKLLLQQQPVARDLRAISAALKMITDMERIGRQSADIAEIVRLAHLNAAPGSLPIGEMAAASMRMVSGSIDAFIMQDLSVARRVIESDDLVDGYFDSIRKELIDRFSQPETDEEATIDLLMIAKYFERIGDHAVNIARWVQFSITGSRISEIE